jgi:membrane-bound lytic murein transglycosylase A
MAGDKRADVLFTGYYQPRIEASLSESGDYRFPIYRRPADLVEMESDKPREKVVGRLEGAHLVPYWSRHEIDIQGKLRGRGYEIAWVKDPVELFFLHIQGSGILKLDDGRMLQINYEASNGRPYRSIGRMLIDNGRVAERDLSMQRLRLYLAEHPEERDQVLVHNESYIFFRVVPDGPLGSLGVLLTPGRSIATDPRFFPRGAVAFIATRKPVLNGQGNFIGWQAFSRFVFNQDRGSAIRGPGRVDLYFGTGHSAGLAAGAMNSRGRVYFLLKKTHAP